MDGGASNGGGPDSGDLDRELSSGASEDGLRGGNGENGARELEMVDAVKKSFREVTAAMTTTWVT